MTQNDDPTLYLLDGLELPDGTLVFACGSASDPGFSRSSILFKINEDWLRHDNNKDTFLSLSHHNTRCFALGEMGTVLEFGNPDADLITSETVQNPVIHTLPTSTDAELICIKCIDQNTFAAGMDGQLYEFNNRDWKTRTIDLPDIIDFRIYGIDGFSEHHFYLAGRRGWLVYWKDGWNRVSIPTNLDFRCITVGSDGSIYAAGEKGVVFRGVEHTWEDISLVSSENDIWSITDFNGSIFAATSTAVFQRVNDEWSILDGPTPPLHRLYSGETRLWSVGELGVQFYDDSVWEKLEVPFLFVP